MIEKTVGAIFGSGFIVGAVFTYSGFLTFLCGFTAGVVFAKTYWPEQFSIANIEKKKERAKSLTTGALRWISRTMTKDEN